MKTLLQINSSLHSDRGQSSLLAARFVYAKGLAMGEDARQQALDGATQAIDRFAA